VSQRSIRVNNVWDIGTRRYAVEVCGISSLDLSKVTLFQTSFDLILSLLGLVGEVLEMGSFWLLLEIGNLLFVLFLEVFLFFMLLILEIFDLFVFLMFSFFSFFMLLMLLLLLSLFLLIILLLLSLFQLMLLFFQLMLLFLGFRVSFPSTTNQRDTSLLRFRESL
jgi:hypothetical protein